MTTLRVGDASADDADAAAALLAEVFPKAPRLDRAWLGWSYLEHPLGRSVVAGARADGRLVAQIAGRPLRARIGADPQAARGVLIHHAATAAAFRRRGLLVELVEAGLAHARTAGAAFAVAVVNASSVGGFVGRLRFTPLGPLDVRLALGTPPPRRSDAPPLEFEPVHDPAWLAWRLAPPGSPYRIQRRDDTGAFWADSGIFGIPVLLGEERCPAGLPVPALDARVPLHAWAGLDPARPYRLPLAAPIPIRLRPSPLHLVFRPLGSGGAIPARGRIRFDALDFDAW